MYITQPSLSLSQFPLHIAVFFPLPILVSIRYLGANSSKAVMYVTVKCESYLGPFVDFEQSRSL